MCRYPAERVYFLSVAKKGMRKKNAMGFPQNNLIFVYRKTLVVHFLLWLSILLGKKSYTKKHNSQVVPQNTIISL